MGGRWAVEALTKGRDAGKEQDGEFSLGSGELRVSVQRCIFRKCLAVLI